MSTDYDAVIIGGGVAGSTAAILLAEAGWSTALVEKQPFPRRKVCGECVAAPNLALLDALGLSGELAEVAGAPLERVGLCVGDALITAALPRFRHPVHRWGRAVGREHLDAALLRRAAAAGTAVWQPWTVRTTAAPRGDRYVCTLNAAPRADRDAGTLAPSGRAQERTLTGRVLITAHGSWERGPSHGGAPPRRRPPRASDLLAFKASFRGARLAPGLLPVLAFDGGYGGLVTSGRDRLTLACCIRRDRLRECRTRKAGMAAGEAVQARLEQSCIVVRDALTGARRDGRWLSAGPLRPGPRATWSAQHGFAIGNRAGEAHPILGEGISMAMQSAWLLCARMTAHGPERLTPEAQRRIGRAYTEDWARAFGARVRWAALFAQLAMRPSAARALWPLLRRQPGMLSAAARIGGKVSVPFEFKPLRELAHE